MKTAILERQSDGSYKIVEQEQTAEMHQEKSVKDVLATLGLDEKKIAELTSNTANLESPAFLDKLSNFELMGVPVGAAATGSAIAILVDRLALAKLDPTNKFGSWANLVAAFALKKWGGKLIGNKTADFAAFVLTYEAVADWVTQGLNKVMPSVVNAQMAQPIHNANSVVNQANAVAQNYYAQAFGG
ncbi:MAG: hypothetical protein PHN44_04380 [Candidatus Marinimicrobia bacterium]|nr:hypothetical protein [Candidatus Neomarinimicrobiota bacterium]